MGEARRWCSVALRRGCVGRRAAMARWPCRADGAHQLPPSADTVGDNSVAPAPRATDSSTLGLHRGAGTGRGVGAANVPFKAMGPSPEELMGGESWRDDLLAEASPTKFLTIDITN